MIMNLERFVKALEAVAIATGKDDLVKICFTKEKDGRTACNLSAYNGKNLQIIKKFKVDGEDDGTYVVSCSRFLNALKRYEALGVDKFELIPNETMLAIRNGENTIQFPLIDKCPQLNMKEVTVGALGSFTVEDTETSDNFRKFVDAVKKATRFVEDSNEGKIFEGIMFEPDESGFIVRGLNNASCYRASVCATITPATEKTREDCSFSVSPAFLQALETSNGSMIKVAVANKFVVVADSKGGRAIVACPTENGSKQTVEAMKRLVSVVMAKYENPRDSANASRVATLKAKVEDLNALCGLAEIACETGERKIVFSFTQTGDTTEVKVGDVEGKMVQCVPGTVTGYKSSRLCYSIKRLQTMLSAIRSEEAEFDFGEATFMLRAYEKEADLMTVGILGIDPSKEIKTGTQKPAKKEEKSAKKDKKEKAEKKEQTA